MDKGATVYVTQMMRVSTFRKGDAIRLLRNTNSSETHFQEAILNFKMQLEARGYPKNLIDGTLSEVNFLRKQTKTTHKRIIPFVTTYHPAVKNLKQLLMQEWSIHNQPMLKNIILQNASYHIIQKREITERHTR